MKLYLIYFFELSLFENNKFLYSHFDFVHQYKFLMIRIYLYYVGFYKLLGGFFLEIREGLRLESKRFYKNKKKQIIGKGLYEDFLSIFSIFAFFKLISGRLFENGAVSRFNLFFSSFFSLDFFLLRKILYSKAFAKLDKAIKLDFLFFFSILIYLSKNRKKFDGVSYLNSILENVFISVISFL